MKTEKKSLSQDSKKSVNNHAQNLISINNLNPCEKAQVNELIMNNDEKVFSKNMYEAIEWLKGNELEWTLELFENHRDEVTDYDESFFWYSVLARFIYEFSCDHIDWTPHDAYDFIVIFLERVPVIYRERVLHSVEKAAEEFSIDLGITDAYKTAYLAGIHYKLIYHKFVNPWTGETCTLYIEFIKDDGVSKTSVTDINEIKDACAICGIDLNSVFFVFSKCLIKKGTDAWNFGERVFSDPPVSRFRDIEATENNNVL